MRREKMKERKERRKRRRSKASIMLSSNQTNDSILCTVYIRISFFLSFV